MSLDGDAMTRALSCRNGHRYTKVNVKTIRERRFSKKKQELVVYVSRQCRRCLNVRKKFEMRRLRMMGKVGS